MKDSSGRFVTRQAQQRRGCYSGRLGEQRREPRESLRSLINARIAWCRRQREQARMESEADEWRAEEDGLRDALLNKNYTDAYRLSTAEAFRRYVRGLREGRAILRVTQVERIVADVATESTTDCFRGDT
ncbi:MAG: hypothetical protein HC801_09570 [Nitrospira sp.]|nr:hypothetical protein [Nitrospira sp.]